MKKKKFVFVFYLMGEFGIFKDWGNVFIIIEYKY